MKHAPEAVDGRPCSPLECLADAGCGADTLERYAALEKAGDRDGQLKLLEKQRRALLDRVHEDEKRIEFLDYLAYQLENRRV